MAKITVFYSSTIACLKSCNLKYDSFKKDNRKNCWFQTRLLPSNFIVLINTDSENFGQYFLARYFEKQVFSMNIFKRLRSEYELSFHN